MLFACRLCSERLRRRGRGRPSIRLLAQSVSYRKPSPYSDNREHARDTRGTSFRLNGCTLVSLSSMLHGIINGTMVRIATLTEALYSAMLTGGPDALTRA